jgi:hypothetical protein
VITSARELWQKLTTDGVEKTGFTRLRFPNIHACPVYAARQLNSGLEALILEADKESIPQGGAFPQSRGFEVKVEAIDPGRTGRARLLLSLVEKRYLDVFVSLVDDVVLHLEHASSPGEAVEGLLSRLTRWQAFLKQHDPEGLTRSERIGLFGELVLMRHLMAIGLKPSEAVASWRGPFGANQDFGGSLWGLEGKASTAVAPTAIRISNVRQLDEAGISHLFLAMVLLDEIEATGRPLPDLIDELDSLLPDPSRFLFAESLTSAGYLAIQRDRYERPKLALREVRLFRVAEGFPRLLESQLPDGVSDVSFSISLAALQPFRCKDADLWAGIGVSCDD